MPTATDERTLGDLFSKMISTLLYGIFPIQKGWNGLKLKQVKVIPRQTADTIKEDVQWIKREIR